MACPILSSKNEDSAFLTAGQPQKYLHDNVQVGAAVIGRKSKVGLTSASELLDTCSDHARRHAPSNCPPSTVPRSTVHCVQADPSHRHGWARDYFSFPAGRLPIQLPAPCTVERESSYNTLVRLAACSLTHSILIQLSSLLQTGSAFIEVPSKIAEVALIHY